MHRPDTLGVRLIIELHGEGRIDPSVQTCDAKRTLYLQARGVTS